MRPCNSNGEDCFRIALIYVPFLALVLALGHYFPRCPCMHP